MVRVGDLEGPRLADDPPGGTPRVERAGGTAAESGRREERHRRLSSQSDAVDRDGHVETVHVQRSPTAVGQRDPLTRRRRGECDAGTDRRRRVGRTGVVVSTAVVADTDGCPGTGDDGPREYRRQSDGDRDQHHDPDRAGGGS